jgi:hypothetical protein
LFSIDEEESVRTSMRESEDDRKKDKNAEKLKNFMNGFDMDVTPDPGTPPVGSPEDAFRNVHRVFDEPSTSAKGPNGSVDGQFDPIAKKIEDYQRESLAQLANIQ